MGRSYHALGEYPKAILVFRHFLKINPDFAPANFFLGRTYISLGFFKKAIRYLKKADAKKSGYAPCLSYLGLAFLKIRRPEISVSYFERALKIDPDNKRIFTGYLNALLVLGIKLFYRNNLIESAQILEFITKYKPNHILPHLYLAIIFKELGKASLSLLHYDRVLEISPNDPAIHLQKGSLLLELGKNAEALMEINLSLKLQNEDLKPVSDPKKILKLIAITNYRNKNYREAIYFARKLLKINYKEIDMHVLIADSYKHFDELDKSKNHYIRALEINQNRFDLYYELLTILWEQKAHGDCLKKARHVLRLKPKDRIALYFQALCIPFYENDLRKTIKIIQDQIRISGPDPHLMNSLAKEYMKAGLPDLAVNWYKRTLKLRKENKQALTGLIEAYKQLDKSKDEIKALNSYLSYFPDDITARKKYIKLLLQENKFKKAASEISKIIIHEPHNKNLTKTLAYCHRKTGKYQEAILLLRSLLKEEPKNVGYLRMLIDCLSKNGNKRAALEILKMASKFIKNNPAILLPLGVLYVKNDNIEEATSIFRELISLKPADWRAYHNLGMAYKRSGNLAFAENFLKRAEELKTK